MLKPLYDKVVLKQIEVSKTTQSGIILTNTTKDETTSIGQVVAISNGRLIGDTILPLSLKVGDKVIYQERYAIKVKDEGEEYLILKEDDVLAIIE